jgi:hypothetical protein
VLCIQLFGVCGVPGVLDVLPSVFLEGVHTGIEPDVNANAVPDRLAWLEGALESKLDWTLDWLF